MEARVSHERRAGEDAALAYAQDFALAQRVVDGDPRAEKQVAQRLVVRVRRAAHAIFGGAPEAEDAALHALIELLRAARSYPGELSLESWADRFAARSLVRFARAVRSRRPDAGGAPPDPPALGRAERTARSLEEFLRALPSGPREALLLREAFGFDLIETSQLLRSSTRAIREQLARARHSVYLRTAKDADANSAALPASVERWFALRDRLDAASPRVLNPHTGEVNDELSAEEREELHTLAAQPELRKLQKELRSLAQFIEGGRFAGLGPRDKKLVQGALAAVRVSSNYDPRTALRAAVYTRRAHPRELDEGSDGSWVRPLSLGLCAGLVVTAFAALALRTPQRATPSAAPIAPRAEVRHAPTVEALSSAQAVQRGPRLTLVTRASASANSPAGVALEQGASLREGDVVSAQAGAGCFVLSPRADVCLAKGSEARVAQLGLQARRVELISGRAVASIERVEPGVPFALSVADLRVESSGAVIGIERDAEQIVVRVLRGSALVANAAGTHALGSAQSAVQRPGAAQLELVPQPLEKARRDWDLLATRAIAPASAPRSGPSARPAAPAEPRPAHPPGIDAVLVDAEREAVPSAEAKRAPEGIALAPALEPSTTDAAPAGRLGSDPALPGGTPEELLAQAKELARANRFAEASALYANLIRSAPATRSAREALVLRGELLSERLREPAEGLALFDRYLGSGGGLLEVRARYGRILALRHLGRTSEGRAASQEFLFSHGNTPQARMLKARAQR